MTIPYHKECKLILTHEHPSAIHWDAPYSPSCGDRDELPQIVKGSPDESGSA